MPKVPLDSFELESRKTISAFRKFILYLREGKRLETGVEKGKMGEKMFATEAGKKKRKVMCCVTGPRRPAHASGQARGLLGNSVQK